MLDPAFVRDHADLVRTGLQNRGLQPQALLSDLSSLDDRRRSLILEVETLKRAQNAAGEEVARLKRLGQDVTPLFDANRERAQRIKQLDGDLEALESERQGVLLTVPNLPHASVPVGASAADNRRSGASASPAASISSRSHTGTWAPRWASSISNARPRLPARASRFCSARERGCPAH